MAVVIPSTGATGAPDQPPVIIGDDGFWPELTVSECREQTGLGTIWEAPRVRAAIVAAAAEVVASIADWRGRQTVAQLSELPGLWIDGQPAAVIHFKVAVYCRVRAQFCDRARDYDSTKSGHARADALESTADGWMQASNEAVARLIGRSRTVVELI